MDQIEQAPVAEPTEERMSRLFIEYEKIADERRSLVSELGNVMPGGLNDLKGVDFQTSELEADDLTKKIVQIDVRLKEIADEQISLIDGGDLPTAYRDWKKKQNQVG